MVTQFLQCGVGRALVVDPPDLEIVALGGTLEAELHIGVLRDRWAPIGEEHGLSVVLEGKLLDEMCRHDRALCVLYQARIHRVADQRLHLGELAINRRAHADCRCHRRNP